MCFVSLAKHMYADRCMDINNAYTHSLLVLIYIPTHKVVQT